MKTIVYKCAEADGKCIKCGDRCMKCNCWQRGLVSYEDWLNDQPERLNPEALEGDAIV
jgi:hypothetical protein